MVDILQELTIKATPDEVFTAITQHDELTQWWANHVIAEPKVGTVAEFRFDNGEVMKMEITKLDAGKNVNWLVRQAPYWEGTTITWDLTPITNGTKLLFGHRGFRMSDAAYEQTRTGWEYFLGSLKSYLETGKGTPYVY